MAPARSSSFTGAIPVWAFVAGGGVAGATIRWAVAAVVSSDGFPVATFLVNVVGCVLLGTVGLLPTRWRDAVAIGVCGGLTTMSTFAVETATFLDEGRAALAVTYLSTSLIAGLAAFHLGQTLWKASSPRSPR